jgi:hypothetical protein
LPFIKAINKYEGSVGIACLVKVRIDIIELDPILSALKNVKITKRDKRKME